MGHQKYNIAIRLFIYLAILVSEFNLQFSQRTLLCLCVCNLQLVSNPFSEAYAFIHLANKSTNHVLKFKS